jgi:hypothetical protein
MELSRPPTFGAGNSSDSDDDPGATSRISDVAVSTVTEDAWARQLLVLAPKLLCLSGTTVWKFSRERILKKQWQDPSCKTLNAVGKSFITWTGRKPVRCISAAVGPSDALGQLM